MTRLDDFPSQRAPRLVDVYQRIWSYHEEREKAERELVDRHAAQLAVRLFPPLRYKFPDCVGEDDKLIACGLHIDVLDYPRLRPTRAETQWLAQADADKELLRDVQRSRKNTAELRSISRTAHLQLIGYRTQTREILEHWWTRKQGREKFTRTAWKFAVQELMDEARNVVGLDERRIVEHLRKRKLTKLGKFHPSDAVTNEFNRLHDAGWTEVFLSEFLEKYSAEAKAIGLDLETQPAVQEPARLEADPAGQTVTSSKQPPLPSTDVPCISITEFADKVGMVKRTIQKVLAAADAPKPYVRAQRPGQAHQYRWDDMRDFGIQIWKKDIGPPPKKSAKKPYF